MAWPSCATVACVAALAVAPACAREHTAVLLRIDADPGAGLQTVAVRVTATDTPAPVLDRVYDLRARALTLPGTVAILARDAADSRELRIRVVGTRAAGPPLEGEAVARFVRGRTSEVDVRLGQGCVLDAGCTGADCDAAVGATDFRADFEAAGMAPFERTAGAAGCFTVTQDAAREGAGAARFAVAPGGEVDGRERCLLYWDASGEREGSDFYYAWSTRLPADFRAPAAPIRLVGWSGMLAPALALELGTDGMFQVAFHTGLVDTEARTHERNPVERTGVQVLPGLWHDFVLHVLFRVETGEGRVELWHRHQGQTGYALVLDAMNFTLQRDASIVLRPSFFLGLDRAPAGDTTTVLHDRVRRGGSMAAVTAATLCP